MNFKPLIFIQVRSDSERLPNKWRRKLAQELTVLEVLLKRIESFGLIDDSFILTSARRIDDTIENALRSSKISGIFRGPTLDVGERFLEAATVLRPTHVVRLTGDNPFVPKELLELLFDGSYADYDYVSTKVGSGYPVGCDVEFFSTSSFRKIRSEKLTTFDREHVTPPYYLPATRADIRSAALSRPVDELSSQRLTIDTEEDLSRLCQAASSLPMSSVIGPWEGVARRLIDLG